MALLASRIEPPVTAVMNVTVPLTPIIEGIGQDAAQATRLLTAVGLSDPYTWCRMPREISCGQMERLRLAHALQAEPVVLLWDEALHALDRTTARAVAWTTQRAVRKAGKSLIACTTDPTIMIDLQPDIVISCGWSPDPQIAYPKHEATRCSLVDQVTYRRGDHSDWAALAHLHYAAGDPATVHSYHVAEIPGMDSPAAVAVFSYPDLHSSARNLAAEDAYKIAGTREAAMKLNREVRKLARIVVAPEVRGCGLSRWLLQEAIPTIGARYVECVAAMGTYHGFLQSCGFREIPQTPAVVEAEIHAAAEEDRTPPQAMVDARLLVEWVDTLSVRRRRAWRRMAWHHWHHFAIHRRTRAPHPKVIPGPEDPRWPDAWNLVAARLGGRPSYWILGPLA